MKSRGQGNEAEPGPCVPRQEPAGAWERGNGSPPTYSLPHIHADQLARRIDDFAENEIISRDRRIAPHDLTNMEGEHIPMGFPVFHNQCAIRMGVALRRAGVADGQIGGCASCAVHPRSDMHFINASQLANALAHAGIPGISPVERITGTEAAHYYPQLFGRTGIIYFQDYWNRTSDTGRATGDHIDVWNGYRSSAKWLLEWFSWLGYYSNYGNAGEIWFWEVK